MRFTWTFFTFSLFQLLAQLIIHSSAKILTPTSEQNHPCPLVDDDAKQMPFKPCQVVKNGAKKLATSGEKYSFSAETSAKESIENLGKFPKSSVLENSNLPATLLATENGTKTPENEWKSFIPALFKNSVVDSLLANVKALFRSKKLFVNQSAADNAGSPWNKGMDDKKKAITKVKSFE